MRLRTSAFTTSTTKVLSHLSPRPYSVWPELTCCHNRPEICPFQLLQNAENWRPFNNPYPSGLSSKIPPGPHPKTVAQIIILKSNFPSTQLPSEPFPRPTFLLQSTSPATFYSMSPSKRFNLITKTTSSNSQPIITCHHKASFPLHHLRTGNHHPPFPQHHQQQHQNQSLHQNHQENHSFVQNAKKDFQLSQDMSSISKCIQPIKFKRLFLASFATRVTLHCLLWKCTSVHIHCHANVTFAEKAFPDLGSYRDMFEFTLGKNLSPATTALEALQTSPICGHTFKPICKPKSIPARAAKKPSAEWVCLTSTLTVAAVDFNQEIKNVFKHYLDFPVVLFAHNFVLKMFSTNCLFCIL